MAAPAKITEYIDKNADRFIQRLSTAVSIKSVSGEPDRREDVIDMAKFLKGELEALGVKVTMVDLGMHTMDGQELPLPPAILGEIGNDNSKKTVCLYAHYDVQPAFASDGWDTDPFKLVIDEKTGRLIGRGSSDDKGPLLGWLNVLEAHVKQDIELPVNLKFCFEGMEESGSEGLDELIQREVGPGKFFDGVDCVCISDNYWLNTRTPCLTYGLRGISYYKVTITGPARDLHSGVFGRMVHEPMTDLIQLMSKLVTPQGDILVPGINELVAPLTDEEKKRYEKLDYSIADVDASTGASISVSSDITTVLMNRMRYPSLSLHGIEGAFYGAGAKTVIPARVSGKFSIRLVPDMEPAEVDRLVIEYLNGCYSQLQSKNKLVVESLHGGKPWMADPTHWNYEAAAKATKAVYGKEPDLTREGGSIPVTLTFADALGVNVLLLPMGRGDDGAHSTNEKLDRSNFIEGSKVLGTYLWEVSKIAT